MITTVLFDLDGTLLPMDQDIFVKDYFGRIAAKVAPAGYDPRQLIDTIWRGTAAMVKNDGSKTNERVFWDYVVSVSVRRSSVTNTSLTSFMNTTLTK